MKNNWCKEEKKYFENQEAQRNKSTLLSVAESQPPFCSYFHPDQDRISRQMECQVQYQAGTASLTD